MRMTWCSKKGQKIRDVSVKPMEFLFFGGTVLPPPLEKNVLPPYMGLRDATGLQLPLSPIEKGTECNCP